ncbi:MAG: hypothetical protein ACKN9W_04375 [Methylococcus sp.]
MHPKKNPRPGRYAGQGISNTHAPIITDPPSNLLLPRLERVRETGPGRWMASCPVEGHRHGDRNRSLSIRETESGDVLLKCFAGHGAAEIAAAVGLELAELFAAAAARGQSGKPRVTRIPWSDVFEAVEFDLRVVSIAAGRMAAGAALSRDDLAALAKRSMDLANTIAEVRNGRS